MTFTLISLLSSAFSQEIDDEADDDFDLQNFTAGSLLAKGSMDFTLFNTMYTESKSNFDEIDYSGFRNTFVTHLFQFTYGVSKSKRVNIGFDLNLKNSGTSVDSSFSGIGTAFQYKNTDSSRVGLTSVGARIKFQPFKSIGNLSIQSTLSIPTIPNAEGFYGDSTGVENRYWADWDRITSHNQLFFYRTYGKFQLFSEIDLLFRFKKYNSQISMLDVPVSLILSYFPTSKITFYAIAQHLQRFPFKNPPAPDWVLASNYTTSGIGFKYNITSGFNIELLYTNFWRGKNTGFGSTYNLGIKYILK
jgi:hypothetical protein